MATLPFYFDRQGKLAKSAASVWRNCEFRHLGELAYHSDYIRTRQFPAQCAYSPLAYRL
ncbi:MAG TPA: hypothetical protein VFB79_17200 [Candidatus Angelobacter sp.]|nr:hypothetical protein [Candidatus Angelobacter sp.]